MPDRGPGLKESGIGNCKLCNCEIDIRDRCKNYFEISMEEEEELPSSNG